MMPIHSICNIINVVKLANCFDCKVTMCTVTHQLVTLAVEICLHTPRVDPGCSKYRVKIF